MTAVLTFLLRKLWMLVAISLVCFALIISALRYSLPLLNDYKPQIQAYLLDNYGLALDIESINANWQASGPQLILQNVSLKESQDSPIHLDVGRVELLVDFWSTLFNMTLQSKDVALNDLHLHINITQLDNGDEDVAITQVLESVFLDQLLNFSVTRSKVTVVREQYSQSFDIEQLNWLNKDERHQARGLLLLDNFATESVEFVLDLTGNIDSYSGVLYATGTQLDISPWINKMAGLGTELVSSDVEFQVWGEINQGLLSEVRAQLLPTTLIWRHKEQAVSSQLTADIQARFVQGDWDFLIQDLNVSVDDQVFSSDWLGHWQPDNSFSLRSLADIELSSWFPLLGIVNPELSESLAASQAHIHLSKPAFAFIDGNFALDIASAKVSLPEGALAPGIDELRFSLNWYGDRGHITVEQDELTLLSDKMFKRDVVLTQVNLPLYIANTNAGLVFYADDFTFNAQEWQFEGSAAYNYQNNMLSLSALADGLELSRVARFFPHHVMGERTIAYLQEAFYGKGNINYAQILWHGNLQNFPFKQEQGIFNIKVDISDADFQFAKDWPALNQLDIQLDFINEGLYMKSPKSLIESVAISNLNAEIPYLGQDAVLSINAQGQGTGKQIADLMLKSSLRDSLGKVLAQEVMVNGALSTELELQIPLKENTQVSASGKVFLGNNAVTISALDLALENAQGELVFDNQNLQIEALEATLLGQEIYLDMIAQQQQDYALDIDIKGLWDIQQSLEQLGLDFADKLSGKVAYDLAIDVQLGAQDYAYQAQLRSKLEQMHSSLPAPFDKVNNQPKPLLVVASGDKVASTVDIALGNDIRFEGVLPHKEKQFSRAHLSIGKSDLLGLGMGFSISANLQSLVLEEWYRAISPIVTGIDKSGAGVLGLPERIFVEAEQLYVADRLITDANVKAKRNSDNWVLDINAKQARGEITIYDQWVAKGIVVNADYVKLASISDTANAEPKNISHFDPKTLPSLDINCSDCRFGKYRLGKFELEATPNNDGLEIQQILIDGEHAKVNASGQWYQRHQDHYTFIAGTYRSDDFGQFLQDFDIDSGIRDSSAEIEFGLTWQNAPMDFATDSLNGEMTWSLSDGYLSEVSDKGSRIFTLLSLNSLVRKLSLDFRDVFAKGFFYDEMQGSIQLTDGKADTRDTLIDGAAGEIEIYGFTDLVSKELNYNISFTPNVTGNLPVLVYFFTVSPPSALAALALDQMLTSAKVISNVNYSVTGTIEEPILIETGRESTEVKLPAQRLPEESNDVFIPPSKDELLEWR